MAKRADQVDNEIYLSKRQKRHPDSCVWNDSSSSSDSSSCSDSSDSDDEDERKTTRVLGKGTKVSLNEYDVEFLSFPKYKIQIQNTKNKIQNTKYKIQNTKNMKHKTQNKTYNTKHKKKKKKKQNKKNKREPSDLCWREKEKRPMSYPQFGHDYPRQNFWRLLSWRETP